MKRYLVFLHFFSIETDTAMNMFVVKSLCTLIIHPLDKFLEVKRLVKEYKVAEF